LRTAQDPLNAPRTILAISGSLRASSSNSAVIRAARELAPPGLSVVIYEGLGDLPHFNFDLDGERIPQPAAAWRQLVARSAGLLISSPEYAHGVPGTLKNALDWLVGSPDFAGKAVTLINASPRSTHAHAALLEVLKTMAARLVPESGIVLPWTGRPLELTGLLGNPDLANLLREALGGLEQALRPAEPT